MPAGKDPGEYVQEFKGDVRAWIMAGLPEGLRVEAHPEPVEEVADPAPSSVTMPAAGTTSLDSAILQEEKPEYYFQTTGDGRRIAVTEDQEIYWKLESQGELVFSRGEMKRITLQKEDAEAEGITDDIAGIMLEIKDQFRGSYIKVRREL